MVRRLISTHRPHMMHHLPSRHRHRSAALPHRVHDHNVKEFMKHGKAAKQVRLPEEKLFLGVRSYELSRLGKQAEKGWCRCLS